MLRPKRVQKLRKVVIVGAVIGAALSLCITLLMDVLYADALKGTWRDAIAKDFSSLFSTSLTSDSPLVYAGFLLILAFLAVIGAGFGAIFAMFVYRFLSFMGSEGES